MDLTTWLADKSQQQLHIFPDPILLTKCQSVTDPAAWAAAVPVLSNIMIQAGGIGLAAPQAGLPWRVFISWAGGKNDCYLNPCIVGRHGKPELKVESCLSLPGQKYAVSRFPKIDVTWADFSGKVWQRTLQALEAQVFQHECDHLDGILLNLVGKPARWRCA